jgi:hypothetical protein
MRLHMLVENSVYKMAINETIQEQLNLPFVEKRKAQMAASNLIGFGKPGAGSFCQQDSHLQCFCANHRLKSKRNFILYLAAPF